MSGCPRRMTIALQPEKLQSEMDSTAAAEINHLGHSLSSLGHSLKLQNSGCQSIDDVPI